MAKKWKLALVQHPMYMLIREDTECAERTPPWGAPTIEAYIDRVRENLSALERYPELKLGYEWSGKELEQLAEDAPDVIAAIAAYVRAGRICFYNGTYAQPHLQTLSSEANLRQFEYGLEVYRALGLPPVRTYAHQEASVHDQVPQILAAFGIPMAVTPGFLTTLMWLDPGEMVLHGVRGPRFVHGSEFAAWEGLDGSQVPLYLQQPIPREMTLKETLAREAVLGCLYVPPVLLDMPDMISVDEEWMAARTDVDFVLLDDALAERLQQHPPQARARLFTNWSYLEGIRLEELSRANWETERSALRAEAVGAAAYALAGRAPQATRDIWKTILAAQHHDVYCFSAPGLRAQSIDALRLAEAEAAGMAQAAAAAVAARVDTRTQPGQALIVFHLTPHPQPGLVSLEVDQDRPQIVDADGTPLPAEVVSTDGGRSQVTFLVDQAGLGYRTVWVQAGGEPASVETVDEEVTFENEIYWAVLGPDATIRSLVLRDGCGELLDAAMGGGNVLSATDSTGLSPETETDDERVDRFNAEPPVRGPQLTWVPDGPARVFRSPLGLTLKVTGKMGERIAAVATVSLYHRLPRIDLTWDFQFDRASVGTFFDDDSKLLVRWPLSFSGHIVHDIPFGWVESREERSFFPIRWVDISDEQKGLAFFHQGTPHHWVSGGTLFNLLGWGEDTEAIHNGLGRYRWPKRFDQRLNGLHTIHSAVCVHTGGWREGGVIAQAGAFADPPVQVWAEGGTGDLPSDLTLLGFDDENLVTTAVFTREDQIVCRAYALNAMAAFSPRTCGLDVKNWQGLDGQATSRLRPFQIGELILEPNDRQEEV